MRLAARIHNTSFVPKALRGDPNSVLACILTGDELGLGPMQSLRMVNVIDGPPRRLRRVDACPGEPCRPPHRCRVEKPARTVSPWLVCVATPGRRRR